MQLRERQREKKPTWNYYKALNYIYDSLSKSGNKTRQRQERT